MSRSLHQLVLSVVVGLGIVSLTQAQDLAPRAYVITPLHANAITLTYSFYDGNVLFDGAVPITDAKARFNVPVVSYYHSFNFFGHSANVIASLPYGVGNYSGTALGVEKTIYRSGLLDSQYRIAVNLKGGPAMPPAEFRKWKQKVIIGASLKVVAPTGQYDPTKLVNYGANRWAFKPELGYSERWGHWVLDAYGAVWFFTTNPEFYSRNEVFPGVRAQTEDPIGAFEGHLSYDFKKLRYWASLDGNFWFGGRTSLNGVPNPDTRQTSSRIGGTVSVPLSARQSLKVSYNDGAYIRFGGNYQSLSLAWQYSWDWTA